MNFEALKQFIANLFAESPTTGDSRYNFLWIILLILFSILLKPLLSVFLVTKVQNWWDRVSPRYHKTYRSILHKTRTFFGRIFSIFISCNDMHHSMYGEYEIALNKLGEDFSYLYEEHKKDVTPKEFLKKFSKLTVEQLQPLRPRFGYKIYAETINTIEEHVEYFLRSGKFNEIKQEDIDNLFTSIKGDIKLMFDIFAKDK